MYGCGDELAGEAVAEEGAASAHGAEAVRRDRGDEGPSGGGGGACCGA